MDIPVVIGSSEETLTIYEHPQIPLSVYSNLIIKYKFDSFMKLGSYIDGKPVPFTDNIFENRLDSDYDYFYGQPGRVFVREKCIDSLGDELNKSILRRRSIDNKGFNLQVQIYLEKDNHFFYQGNMDNTGFFPFLIKRDKNDKENILDTPPVELTKVGKK